MTELEKQAMYNMLVEIKCLAANASLTGALRKGTPTLVMTFNKCLTALKEKGDTTASQLFPELSLGASIDDVGIAAALLASYLPESRRSRGLSRHDIIAFNHDHDDDDDDED